MLLFVVFIKQIKRQEQSYPADVLTVTIAMFLSPEIWGQTKVVLFPQIGRVKNFCHSPARIVECVSEYTFLISKNNKQTKAKETKDERRIFPEDRLKT